MDVSQVLPKPDKFRVSFAINDAPEDVYAHGLTVVREAMFEVGAAIHGHAEAWMYDCYCRKSEPHKVTVLYYGLEYGWRPVFGFVQLVRKKKKKRGRVETWEGRGTATPSRMFDPQDAMIDVVQTIGWTVLAHPRDETTGPTRSFRDDFVLKKVHLWADSYDDITEQDKYETLQLKRMELFDRIRKKKKALEESRREVNKALEEMCGDLTSEEVLADDLED